jgi:type IV pilus assembly protein PilV
MVAPMRRPSFPPQHGASMIEVLVTIVILTFGLLGLAGLQSRLHLSEVEAYQRAQALLLVEDMANRISVNRGMAASYVTPAGAPLGAGNELCTVTESMTLAEADACEWNNALLGAAATDEGSGNRIGTVVGGRGCIEQQPGDEYLVTVAWQGLAPISTPSAEITCGAGQYDGTDGSPCANDRCRRVVTTIVRIGSLT